MIRKRREALWVSFIRRKIYEYIYIYARVFVRIIFLDFGKKEYIVYVYIYMYFQVAFNMFLHKYTHR